MRSAQPIVGTLVALVLVAPMLACPGDDIGPHPGLSEGESDAGDETGGPGDPGEDLKTVDASNCVLHPSSLLAEVELQLSGEVLASTALRARVLCPLVRDSPSGAQPWRVDVTVIDNNTQSDMSCMALARDLSGEVVSQSEIESTSGSAGAQLLSLLVPESEAFAYHYVDCSLPGIDSGGGMRSGVASFVTHESKVIEQENVKLYPGIQATYNPASPLGPAPLIDELGYGELYFPDEGGLSSVFLPVIRDNPEATAAQVRIHYYKEEGAFLSCVLTSFYDTGIMGPSNSAQALEGPFGTIQIPFPLLPITDGPYEVICLTTGAAAILAYDLAEP